MRKLLAAVVFAAAAVPLSRADDAADAAKRLDGTYAVVEATRGGKAAPKGKGPDAVVIKNGTFTIKSGKQGEPARFKLDPSKKPAQIDLTTPDEGGLKGETMPGIYEAKDAADGFELTVAFSQDPKARPTDFKGEGRGVMVLKLQRKKDAK